MVTYRTRAGISGLVFVALGIGLAGIAGGCGRSTGEPSQGGVEKAPESVELLKNSMKERAASLKGRKGGAPGKR